MQLPKSLSFSYDDDIFIIRYLSHGPVTLETAKMMVKFRKEMTNGDECKLLVVFPRIQDASKDARAYLSTHEATEGIIGSAIVTDSIITKVIINFFLKIDAGSKIDFPVRTFKSETSARKWLRRM